MARADETAFSVPPKSYYRRTKLTIPTFKAAAMQIFKYACTNDLAMLLYFKLRSSFLQMLSYSRSYLMLADRGVSIRMASPVRLRTTRSEPQR